MCIEAIDCTQRFDPLQPSPYNACTSFTPASLIKLASFLSSVITLMNNRFSLSLSLSHTRSEKLSLTRAQTSERTKSCFPRERACTWIKRVQSRVSSASAAVFRTLMQLQNEMSFIVKIADAAIIRVPESPNYYAAIRVNGQDRRRRRARPSVNRRALPFRDCSN